MRPCQSVVGLLFAASSTVLAGAGVEGLEGTCLHYKGEQLVAKWACTGRINANAFSATYVLKGADGTELKLEESDEGSTVNGQDATVYETRQGFRCYDIKDTDETICTKL